MNGKTIKDDADNWHYCCKAQVVLHLCIDFCQLKLELPRKEGIEARITYQQDGAEDDEPQLTHAVTEQHDADKGEQNDNRQQHTKSKRSYAERTKGIVALSGCIGEVVEGCHLGCPHVILC